MKKLILSIVALFCLSVCMSPEPAFAYEPATTSTKSKKSSSKKKTTKTTSSSSTSSTPSWLPGKYIYPRIDTIFNEYVYEIYEIGNDGFMRFGESTSKYGTPNNRKFGYYVKGNILYASDDNQPLLKLNSSNKSLIHYQNPDRVFVKVK